MAKLVQVIPARKVGAGDGEQGAAGEREKRKLRVAAYCRVSTEQEEQLGSFANQVEYYTRLIEGEEDWAFAGIRSKFQQGIPHVNTTRLFGFDKDEEGQLRVNPEQGAVVRRIFREYLRGFGEGEIARRLREDGIPGITGASRWSSTTVRRMLQNEKYQGDLLLQKYYTVSFLTGESVRNEGALDQYFVMDAHEGIVSREEWEAVQQERERRLMYREEFQLKKLENTDPFFNRIRCEACGGMVVRGYGKAGREAFWRCAAACRKHRGTSTRTTFPEQEVRRVMCEAWAELVENRAVYEMKWRATMESPETLALEKVRARQMMALIAYCGANRPGLRSKTAAFRF